MYSSKKLRLGVFSSVAPASGLLSPLPLAVVVCLADSLAWYAKGRLTVSQARINSINMPENLHKGLILFGLLVIYTFTNIADVLQKR